MSHTGAAYLPLHGGWAPAWLVKRMKSLAHNITLVMVEDLGRKEFLKRISDPCWFQAFGCVLGFDWHSSGVTTVVTAVLKNAVDPSETGLAVCGGKGAKSKFTPDEICRAGDMLGLSTRKLDELVYASRMGAKVDNAAIQAGYPLYHHSFLLTEDGDWAIVQQGLNTRTRMARRYHWLSDGVKEFVVEPHNAIVGKKEDRVLDMTARESDGCRRSSVDVVKGDPKKIKKDLAFIREKSQKSLQEWCGQKVIVMPWNINWKVLEQAYNAQPRNYEELLSMPGIGPTTVKGLALISELIYGESPSWRDPVKYSFAFGGKDGVPFPVRRKEMDEATEFLRVAIMNAKLDGKERMAVLRRLKEFTGND